MGFLSFSFANCLICCCFSNFNPNSIKRIPIPFIIPIILPESWMVSPESNSVTCGSSPMHRWISHNLYRVSHALLTKRTELSFSFPTISNKRDLYDRHFRDYWSCWILVFPIGWWWTWVILKEILQHIILISNLKHIYIFSLIFLFLDLEVIPRSLWFR